MNPSLLCARLLVGLALGALFSISHAQTAAQPGLDRASAAAIPLLAQAPAWPPITAAPVAERITGRWVWGDLLTHDVAAAKIFYGKVFGWTFETIGATTDQGSYTRVLSGGHAIAGMLSPRTPAVERGARWIGLISVPDPAATATRVGELGGSVLMTPRPFAGRGDVALLADPAGALFAVIRTSAGDPPDVAGRENEWLWVELWAADPAREAEFYRAVFGYGLSPLAGGTAGSIVLTAGGRARAGVLRKPDAELKTEWIPYVRVRSVNETVARALAAGARLVIAPTPHHRSRTAVLVDPAGAPFAVAEWRPQ